MRTIGLNLILSFKIFAYSLALFCTYSYLSEKVEYHTTPQEIVIRRCSGYRNPETVCDCYANYGRHCLSDKMLIWDWSPAEPEASEPSRPLDPTEEEETTAEAA